MTAVEVTMYRLRCDGPGPEHYAEEDSDYYAWSDADTSRSMAEESGWDIADVGETGDYCDEHREPGCACGNRVSTIVETDDEPMCTQCASDEKGRGQ